MTTETNNGMLEQQTIESVIAAFAAEFLAVYICDLEDGKYQILRRDDEVYEKIKMLDSFVDAISKYSEATVHPLDIKMFRKLFHDIESVKARLAPGESYSFEYRSNSAGTGKYHWYRMSMKRINKVNLLIGFNSCNEAVQARLISERRNKLVGELGSEYEVIFFANAVTKIGEVYHQRPSGRHHNQLGTEDIFQNFHHGVRRQVYPEDVEETLRGFSRQNIIEQLEKNKEFDVRYRVIEDGRPQVYEARFIRADDENGQLCFITGIRNIDAEVQKSKKQQKQLEEALAMAQSANKAKTSFLNNISHDIRTPMNAIIGYTNLAASHIDNKEQVMEYLDKIARSSNHLLSLINDVLDMSRIESGKMNIEEKVEDLDTIIETLKDLTQDGIKERHLKFKIEKKDLVDKFVYCDKLRLNQVLINILSNSIKYTPQGGSVSMRVTETKLENSGYARYEFLIKDTGIGMSEEFQKTLFEPFTRARTTTMSGIKGTGLGMAITKNIVDMMGGKIEVKSELNKGTEMKITVDLKKGVDESTPLPQKEKAKKSPSKGEIGGTSKSFHGKRVMLVEDNDLNLEIARIILEEMGILVDTATDGTIAVEKFKNATANYYNLILMDIQMPLMNGYDATRAIRELERSTPAILHKEGAKVSPVRGDIEGSSNGSTSHHIPIIAMTANAFEEDRKMAFEAGMNEHIAKPIDINRLKELLAKFL